MSSYDGSHKYQVVFVDEYNNWWLCGFYDDLKEALPQVNSFLSLYEPDKDAYEDVGETDGPLWLGEGSPFGDIGEYAGTIGSVFDITLYSPCGSVQVRGFVLL